MSHNIWQITHWELVIRMVVAAVLGGLIGIEREWSNHAAGFRTHILVCLGSTTIMLLSIYGFSEFVNETNVRVDPARLAAQVISGIGFLGAGAILRNGNVIKGLTTAASVWVVAAIGLCVGAGFFTGALVCTLMVLISLYLLNKWEKVLLKDRRNREVEIKIFDQPGALGTIASIFGEQDVQIANLKMLQGEPLSQDGCDTATMLIVFALKVTKPEKFAAALERISSLDVVIGMEVAGLPGFKQSGAKERTVSL